MSAEDDLDALLESALDDFTRDAKTPNVAPPSPIIPQSQPQSVAPSPPPPSPSPKENTNNTNDGDIFSKLMGMFGTGGMDQSIDELSKILENDQLRNDFESEMQKLVQSLSSGELPDDFQKMMSGMENFKFDEENTNEQPNAQPSPSSANSPFGKALDSLFQHAREVEEKQEDKDEGGIGNLLGMLNNPEMMEAVQLLADRFLSKDVLHGVMTDIQKQYTEWLEKNGGSATPEDLQRYKEQLKCIEDVIDLYNNNEEPDEKQVTDLLMKFQSIGKLPEDMLFNSDIGK